MPQTVPTKITNTLILKFHKPHMWREVFEVFFKAHALAFSVLPNPPVTSQMPKRKHFGVAPTAIIAGIASALVSAHAYTLLIFLSICKS